MAFNHLRPVRMRRRLAIWRSMTYGQLMLASIKLSLKFWLGAIKMLFNGSTTIMRFIFNIMVDDSTSPVITRHHQALTDSSPSGSRSGRRGVSDWNVKNQANDYSDCPDLFPVNSQSAISMSADSNLSSHVTTGSVVRTELITAPSLMTASVADVMSESVSSTNASTGMIGTSFSPVAQTVSSTPVASNDSCAPTTSGTDVRLSSAHNVDDTYLTAVPQSFVQAGSLLEVDKGVSIPTGNALGVTPKASSVVTTANGPQVANVTKVNEDDGDQIYLDEVGLTEEETLMVGQANKSSKSSRLGQRLSQLTNYNQKIVSFLARNFYRIKLLALITAFIINFILLFYKVSVWVEAGTQEQNLNVMSILKVAGSDSFEDTDGAVDDEETFVGVMSIDSTRENELNELTAKVHRGLDNYENRYGFSGKPHRPDERDDLEKDRELESKRSSVDYKKGRSKKDANPSENERTNGTDQSENREETDNGKSLDVEEDSDEDDEDENTDLAEYVVMEEKYYYLQHILTILACIHTVFSFCMLIAYYHLKVPLVIFKREKELARKLEFDGLYITEEPDSDDWWNGYWDKLVISAESFPVNYWDKFVKKRVREKFREQYDYEALSNLLGMQQKQKTKAIGSGASPGLGLTSYLFGAHFVSALFKIDWRYQLWKTGVTLTDKSFQYQLVYLTFSLAGHFNYFFFAFHLLDVAVGFKKLQTILQSVTHNGKQLVLTVMLLTIVVYIYTVFAFNFFRKFYIKEDTSDQKCHSMMTCFVYHLYQGVRAGGGIGDVIEAPDGDDYEVYRIIFDITFFFFVIVILVSIIQGLIIDAFGELRDQLLTVAADMEKNCFICGIGKDVLDKVPRGFDTHVQKEHNLANYMFFLMHLINKPDTDYTGQETYVWELYQRRCWDFFPVGECFRTQSEEEADVKPVKD